MNPEAFKLMRVSFAIEVSPSNAMRIANLLAERQENEAEYVVLQAVDKQIGPQTEEAISHLERVLTPAIGRAGTDDADVRQSSAHE